MVGKNFVDDYLKESEKIAKLTSREDIEKIISLLFKAWKEGKQVFLAGNGGSAGTASHLAGDLSKYVATGGKKAFRAISLNDNVPLLTALTNDVGWENVYIEQLKNHMQKGDVLVVMSVHGGSGSDKAGPWSQNLLKAAKYAQEHGGKVVGFSGFDGGVLKQMADACVVAPAESTPHVEGFHSVYAHMIIERLRQMIAET